MPRAQLSLSQEALKPEGERSRFGNCRLAAVILHSMIRLTEIQDPSLFELLMRDESEFQFQIHVRVNVLPSETDSGRLMMTRPRGRLIQIKQSYRALFTGTDPD